MAKRKDLKAAFNYVCGELANECMLLACYRKNIDLDKVNALLEDICATNADYVSRVSHVEPGMTAKAYFNEVIKGFNEKTNQIIDQLKEL